MQVRSLLPRGNLALVARPTRNARASKKFRCFVLRQPWRPYRRADRRIGWDTIHRRVEPFGHNDRRALTAREEMLQSVDSFRSILRKADRRCHCDSQRSNPQYGRHDGRTLIGHGHFSGTVALASFDESMAASGNVRNNSPPHHNGHTINVPPRHCRGQRYENVDPRDGTARRWHRITAWETLKNSNRRILPELDRFVQQPHTRHLLR
jgi:hypothetical protein